MSRETKAGDPDYLPHGPIQAREPAAGDAVTQASPPRPVLATIRWLDGVAVDVPGIALAWTTGAVHVVWEEPGAGLSRTWIPVCDVRRGQAAMERIARRG